MTMSMENELRQISNRIKEVRKAHNVTQKQLAEALDISVTNMCNIENGKTAVTIQNLIKMKNFYGCEMKDFFICDEEINIGSAKSNKNVEENLIPADEFSSRSDSNASENTNQEQKLPESIDLQDAINLLRLLRRIDIKGI